MLTTDTNTDDTGPVLVPLDLGAIEAPSCAAARPLLDPLLKPGTLTLIRGESGIGKSWLALALAHAIASGRSVLDWTAPQSARVLYVDGALSPGLLKARTAALGTAPLGQLRILSSGAVPSAAVRALSSPGERAPST